jgi:hypothetical protein
MGKLLEFLGVQRMLSGDGVLTSEIAELESEERELRSQVDGDVIAQRKEDALLLISKYAQHYGQLVQLEDNDALIKLDTRELSVRVLNERGESAWLNQIGSGANHLGYHVAMLLALHEFFVTKPIPFVPSLLILDQPSQTQFPDDLDEEAEREELIAVHKAFEACDSAIGRTNGMLQIIVSEHAGKAAYSGIESLTVVERWRRGRKLIPWHWDTEALDELSGLSAEWALEDLKSSTLIPAIVLALGSSHLPDVSDIQTDRAVFANRSIEFNIQVPERYAEKTKVHIMHGYILQDLTVSISESLTS